MRKRILCIISLIFPYASYGFYQECIQKYGDERVWKCFTQLFSFFPIAAIIEERFFTVHGGLSPSICSIDQIQELNRVREVPNISLSNDVCCLIAGRQFMRSFVVRSWRNAGMAAFSSRLWISVWRRY